MNAPLRAVRGRKLREIGGLVLALCLGLPAAARAHGLVGRTSLPAPAWVFAWAAGLALVASFAALGRLWSEPRLGRLAGRRLCRLPRAVEIALGAAGVGFTGLVIVSGVAGSQAPLSNLAPTAVFVLFWVGLPVLSVLLGDVYALLNPWRALARPAAGVGRRLPSGPPLAYPERLGRWPAAAGVVAFGWLELVFTGRDRPATLAVLLAGYGVAQLVGMAAFGVEAWCRRGDAFAVAFGLFARLAPLSLRSGEVRLRPPLAGLADVERVPGTAAVVLALIGTTTFDGFLNGPVWRALAPGLERALRHLGLGGTGPVEVAGSVGLLACIGLCTGLYALGVRGAAPPLRPSRPRRLAVEFAPSLVPIAFGYLLAHYFSLLISQGQAAAYLISDPLGTGADLFGTAGVRVNPGLVSAAAIWYVQVLALLAGHVSGLIVAHDAALGLAPDPPAATASQRPLLVVMVTFTCLGLWLLSAVNT